MYPATPSPPSSMLLPRSSSLSSSPMAVVPFAPAKCDLELSVSFSQPDLDSEVSVSALGFLPADSVSKAYPVEEICQKTAIPSGRRITIRKSSSTGLLTPNEADSVMKSCNWIRSIKLASDVRSYNAVLELTQSQLIRLRLIRDVTAEEELQLWFSEDVAALMQIPFLTPANIQRQNCYVCHVCRKCYEYPNPLKIHMATSCGQQSMSSLWQRLLHSTTRYGFADNPGCGDFTPWRSSAFRPVLTATSHAVKVERSPPPVPPLNKSPPHHHSVHHHHHHHPLVDESTMVTAAHLETIVSNMGSSKQGHICIYCGKLYSRKYGLKIHIRTHTGFKPLKCQYCLRPFGDPSNLNKHIRLHRQHDSSLYECNLCGKKLARRRDLQRHLQSRHNSSQVIDSSTSEEEDILP
ncbi:histone-lysine N-methyltransferase MECOM [Culex quinquefasciatus]|uniref:histone-lysine N-methyltransferase MECOM n=1 Tax=Culex quinquefasciatus TaxID=7176 RepID=UPI0018E2B720|nr:histone-lysine N-methyltransferase MECOM [Culex quinquefasciatus]